MVKFFSAESASALESAINTFLGDDYTIVSINYFVKDGWHQAMVGYTAVAESASGSDATT